MLLRNLIEEHFLKAMIVLVIMGLIFGLIGTYAVAFLMALFNIFNVIAAAIGGVGG